MTDTRPILILGAAGQLGRALCRMGENGIASHPVTAWTRAEGDLSQPAALTEKIMTLAPAAIINAAAYTAVDAAESDEETAICVNAEAVGAMGKAAAALNIPVLHVSTDYVFDGTGSAPLTEDYPTGPLSAYGRSKLAGEKALRAETEAHVILRTAWVYAPEGQNFLRSMLRLGAEREELGIVANQTGTPTLADDIATALIKMTEDILNTEDPAPLYGIYHFTNAGHTTWHGFATAIFERAAVRGWKVPRDVKPITTADYPTPARRPAWSVLDCSHIEEIFGIKPRPWEAALDSAFEILDDMNIFGEQEVTR